MATPYIEILAGNFHALADKHSRETFDRSSDVPGPVRDHTDALEVFQDFRGIASQISDEVKQRGDAARNAGGIRVQNLQINVEGAGDPSRVARLVVSEFQKMARNPTKSSGTPDYAGPRR